jgi:hypothetical protein
MFKKNEENDEEYFFEMFKKEVKNILASFSLNFLLLNKPSFPIKKTPLFVKEIPL